MGRGRPRLWSVRALSGPVPLLCASTLLCLFGPLWALVYAGRDSRPCGLSSPSLLTHLHLSQLHWARGLRLREEVWESRGERRGTAGFSVRDSLCVSLCLLSQRRLTALFLPSFLSRPCFTKRRWLQRCWWLWRLRCWLWWRW